MNISGDLQPLPQTAETYPASNAVAKTTAGQSATPQQGGDEAHLSAAANLVSHSIGQSDVRADKVASVQAAIAGGTYHVESSQVASKLIDHLLGGQQ